MQTIRLHGGPKHGEIIGLRDGENYLVVMKPESPLIMTPEATTATPIPMRKGIYSRVGKSDDFEFEGWGPPTETV